jgi:3-carboxy-cis,cis-muconate cycloisomerase
MTTMHADLPSTASTATESHPGVFDLLSRNFADPEIVAVFSEQQTIKGWLRTEQALAQAQGEVGVITVDEANAVAAACDSVVIDRPALWSSAANVGYPILGLVRQVAASLPAGPNGRVHYGATTQDIMDTGLALQLVDAAGVLQRRLDRIGDGLAVLVDEHRGTVMPGRTHAQHAVPTTFGAHLAPLLAEVTRGRARLADAAATVGVVSLFGAGGTSAAAGPASHEVRARVAAKLGLRGTEVSWHPARDSIAAFGQVAAGLAASCARLARNVIDLSRTEIGEIREEAGAHRGASSTMPQKANPILAEGIIGLAATAGPLSAALFRAMEVPQERAAGEWQIEWFVLPNLVSLVAGALKATDELLAGLRVDAAAMRRNLDHDGGLIMAEAYMIALAPDLGRESAHDLVYAAVGEVRNSGASLAEAVAARLAEDGTASPLPAGGIAPQDYVGEAEAMCTAAIASWKSGGTEAAI